MTVTASIKENTGFGVIWGWHSQKRIPEDQHSVPSPIMPWSPQGSWSPASPAEDCSSPVTPNQTLLSETQSPLAKGWTSAQEALWSAKHTAPCEETVCHPGSRLPTLCSSTWVIHRQQVWGAGAQQPKCSANKLSFIKCRNSKLGCWQQWKRQQGMRCSYSEQVSAQPAENKARTAPAPPLQEIFVQDLFCSQIFCSITPVSISSCPTNTHTEHVAQQLNKLNQAL